MSSPVWQRVAAATAAAAAAARTGGGWWRGRRGGSSCATRSASATGWGATSRLKSRHASRRHSPSAPSLHPLRPLRPLCTLCTLCTLYTPFSGGTVERSAAARGRRRGSGRLPARVRGAARAGGGALPQGGADAACGGVPRARVAAARGLGAGAAVRGRRRLRRELCWQGLRVRGLRGDAQGSLQCIGWQPRVHRIAASSA